MQEGSTFHPEPGDAATAHLLRWLRTPKSRSRWDNEAEAQNSAPGGLAHFVELDEMQWMCGTPNIYYNNSHDWWNYMTGHIQISNNITPPAGTNFSQWHVWGVYGGAPGLCATGYRQAYFDGVAVGNKITWQDCSNAYPPVAQTARHRRDIDPPMTVGSSTLR
jgi:hypothetical protein